MPQQLIDLSGTPEVSQVSRWCGEIGRTSNEFPADASFAGKQLPEIVQQLRLAQLFAAVLTNLTSPQHSLDQELSVFRGEEADELVGIAQGAERALVGRSAWAVGSFVDDLRGEMTFPREDRPELLQQLLPISTKIFRRPRLHAALHTSERGLTDKGFDKPLHTNLLSRETLL